MKVELQNVSKSYRIGGQEVPVLHNVSFTFPEGKALAVTGPSGVGKSTLLHILGGLDAPTSGNILFDDADLAQLADEPRARFRGKHIGFVFQFHHLLAEFSALENVAMPLVISGMTVEEARESSFDILQRVGLEDRVEHLPGQLSGGQQQRVAVARSLVTNPDVVFADEPTGNLDAQTSRSVTELLLELHQEQGNTLVIVTHNQELAESLGIIAEMKAGGGLERRS